MISLYLIMGWPIWKYIEHLKLHQDQLELKI